MTKDFLPEEPLRPGEITDAHVDVEKAKKFSLRAKEKDVEYADNELSWESEKLRRLLARSVKRREANS